MNFITVAKCKNQLKALAGNQIDLTLSLAFHSTVSGNVAPFKDVDQTIVNRLDSKYRQFISVKWDKENKAWTYSSAKSKKLLKKLGLTFKESTFEDFCTAVENSFDLAEQARIEKEQAEQALDPVAQKNKEINDTKATVEKYLTKKAETLTEAQMLDIVRSIYNGKQATAA